jgi:HEAT repeat protein
MMFFDRFFQKKPDTDCMVRNRDINGLIRLLYSQNPEIQASAVHALGCLGSDATESLIPALKKKNKNLRLGVIGALAEIKDFRAVPSLIEMIQNPSSEIRWQAAIALGEIGDAAVSPVLLEALSDSDKYVRYGSAISLMKIGHKPVNETEWAWYFAGMQAWEKLTELGSVALPPLENLLLDLDSEVRIKAVKTLGEIGDRNAGPALIRSLGDGNRQVRWQAVLASQKCGVPPMYLPRGLFTRPRMKKSPLVAGFLNFLLPGLGYGYLGKWWGVMIFQIDITLTVWLFKMSGEANSYSVLFPLYLLLGIHAWYITSIMPEEAP